MIVSRRPGRNAPPLGTCIVAYRGFCVNVPKSTLPFSVTPRIVALLSDRSPCRCTLTNTESPRLISAPALGESSAIVGPLLPVFDDEVEDPGCVTPEVAVSQLAITATPAASAASRVQVERIIIRRLRSPFTGGPAGRAARRRRWCAG